MRLIFRLIILSFFLFTKAIGQNAEKKETERLTTLFHKLEGTFQVQVVNSRAKPEIPLWVADSVQVKRHQTQIIYLKLKPHIRVMILPFSVINQPNFKPVSTTANIFEN